MRYTERLADTVIEPSADSRRRPLRQRPRESVIGLFKTEVIRRRSPLADDRGRGIRDPDEGGLVQSPTAAPGPIGYVPPAECEARYHERDAVA
jgi:putative transposase